MNSDSSQDFVRLNMQHVIDIHIKCLSDECTVELKTAKGTWVFDKLPEKDAAKIDFAFKWAHVPFATKYVTFNNSNKHD